MVHFKVFMEVVTILLLFCVLVFWPQGMGDLTDLTGGQIHTPCYGRQSLNHWTAKEVKLLFYLHLSRSQVRNLQVICRWGLLPPIPRPTATKEPPSPPPDTPPVTVLHLCSCGSCFQWLSTLCIQPLCCYVYASKYTLTLSCSASKISNDSPFIVDQSPVS